MNGIHMNGDFGNSGINALMYGYGDDSSAAPPGLAPAVPTPTSSSSMSPFMYLALGIAAILILKKLKKKK